MTNDEVCTGSRCKSISLHSYRRAVWGHPFNWIRWDAAGRRTSAAFCFIMLSYRDLKGRNEGRFCGRRRAGAEFSAVALCPTAASCHPAVCRYENAALRRMPTLLIKVICTITTVIIQEQTGTNIFKRSALIARTTFAIPARQLPSYLILNATLIIIFSAGDRARRKNDLLNERGIPASS